MTVCIETEEGVEVHFPFDYKKTAEDVINFTLDKEGFPFEAEVNVLLTDNAGIQKINLEHRQIGQPTDVLSFPMINYEKAGDFLGLASDEDNFNPDTGEAVLGDIIISVDKAAEQAQNYGHSELREFAFLLVHSMLHLFGYDHIQEEEAAVMEALQRQILEEMNILR